MPNDTWFEFDNLGGVGDSIFSGFVFSDFLLIAFIVLLVFFSTKFSTTYPKFKERVCILVIFPILTVLHIGSLQPITQKALWFFYQKDAFVCHHGFAATIAQDVISSAPRFTLSSADRVLIDEAVERPAFINSFEKPKHILFFIVESLNSRPIGEIVDGVVVTPTLNMLAEKGVYCKNMVSETQKGNSSDGQFICFTGLLPMENYVTVMYYLQNKFYGLGDMARDKGYETLFLNCSVSTMWRQVEACKSYGETYHYSSKDFEDVCGYKSVSAFLNDEEVFEYAYNLVKKHESAPMFLTILTASMHSGYKGDFSLALNNFSSVADQEYKCYLQKTNYMDAHLGKFLDRLEKDSILDDMLIVVAADHAAPCNFGEAQRGKIPLIVCGKGIEHRQISMPLRQIDVYPTILNLMGYEKQPYMGLGYSVFDLDKGVSRPANDVEITRKVSDLILGGNFFK